MAEDLYAALAELQADPPTIRRKAEGQVGTSRKFKYADLDTIWKATADWRKRHGITWICRPNAISPLNEAATIRVLSYELHHSKSGQNIMGDYPLPATGDGQALGAAITYARRYAFCAVTGLIAEDDTDGQPPRERTQTKIPGPEHERLRDMSPPDPDRIERSRGPANVSGFDEIERQPESIGDNQRSRIMRHLGRLSKAERAERLRNLVGRDDIESTNDLSWAEAAEVIKVLEA